MNKSDKVAGIREISGYVPKEGTPDERIVRYTKEVKQLEFKLLVAKRNLAYAERQVRKL